MSYCSVVNVRVSSIACIKSNLAGWKVRFPSRRDWFLYPRLCRDRRSFASEVSRNLLTFFFPLCRSTQLLYFIISKFVCQELFSRFFYRSDQSLSATFIEYHVSVTLSSTFLFFFIFSMICFRLSQRQLSYNSTPDSLCQLLFSIFSSFSQFYFFPVTYCIIHTKNRTFQKQNVRFA